MQILKLTGGRLSLIQWDLTYSDHRTEYAKQGKEKVGIVSGQLGRVWTMGKICYQPPAANKNNELGTPNKGSMK